MAVLPPRRRRRVPQLRREELLDAAFRVLQRLGPEKCRVADVTQEAGAAKGTFYLYFSGWDDMLGALRSHILAQYAADLDRRMAGAAQFGWADFEAEVMRFVRFLSVLGPLHRAIFHGAGQADAVHPGADTQKLIAGLLDGAIRAGAIRPVDPETAAPLLFAMLHISSDCLAALDHDDPAVNTLREVLQCWLAVQPQA